MLLYAEAVGAFRINIHTLDTLEDDRRLRELGQVKNAYCVYTYSAENHQWGIFSMHFINWFPQSAFFVIESHFVCKV